MPLPILGAIASLGGGLLGNIFASNDKNKARELAQEAYNELAAMGLPPDLSRAIILQKFQEAGSMSPEMEQAIDIGISEVSQIQEDPSLKQAQTGALQQLQQVAKGGLRPEDRAAYNELRNKSQQAQQGRSGLIQQQFQARGQGGQGAELAAQIANAQSGANQMSQQGDQISADASRRALEALSSSGQLAGQVRGQDFDVNRTKAGAADQFKQFNAANSMAIQSRNIAAKNAAQAANLANQQAIANANVGQSNQELLRQQDAQRQFWNDKMARQQAVSGAKLGQANIFAGQAANTAQNWQGIGSGVGGAINAVHSGNQWKDLMDRMYPQKSSATIRSPGAAPTKVNPYMNYDDDEYKKAFNRIGQA